ncbi:MAG: HDOD domain-containing protein [bacterium]|nr:HDOD domain-containing protein [bacterium]
MGTAILVLLVLLIIALGWNIVSSAQDTPAKRTRRKPAKSKANPTQQKRKAVTRATDPAMAAPALDYFKPAVEDGEFLFAKQSAGDSMNELMDQAEMVSQKLASRQNILSGFSDADYDPKKVSELVLSDPGLAAEVLKTVNSPFYGLSQQIASVFRAIVLLGHVEVRNIIWRTCVGQTESIEDVRVNMFLDDLWQHSFSVSRVAYVIAKERGLSEPDSVSTTALLHDIGKLICVNTWPEKALGIYNPVAFSSSRVLAEEAELGMNHAALGAEVAQSWGLPGETCSTVRHYHAPSYVGPDEIQGDRAQITVVHVADLICHNAAMQSADVANAVLYLPRDGWLQTIGVNNLQELFTPGVMKALPRSKPPAKAAAPQEKKEPQPA